MKNTKKKKPLNKWKLTAIISLIINGIVALLLVVGLATPKTYAKTNAVGQYGDYYIYENSNNINASLNEWSDYESVTGVSRWTNASGQKVLSFDFSENEGSNYLLSDTLDHIFFYFSPFDDSSVIPETPYYLALIHFYPYGLGSSIYYEVYRCTWVQGMTNFTYTYNPLGLNSPFVFIPNGLNTNIYDKLDNLFINKGTNEVIKDYQIGDNFNPNKYISLAMDSQGLLYDSPTDYWNSDTKVVWSFPIYRGKISQSDPYDCSTLGFLELPFLFTSGGENFVSIRFYFDVVQQYIDKNNEVQTLNYGSSVILHQYHYTFVYMSYCYELASQGGTPLTTWREKVVCAVPIQRMYVDYTNEYGVNYRNYVYMPFQSFKWLNESYKTIGVYQASTEQLSKVAINENVSRSRWAINQYTIEQVLNYDMTQNASGINTGNYVGNVFILIKHAFDSVTGLLAISILPGISIGVLLFLPLVLTIIIVVIKLVKR